MSRSPFPVLHSPQFQWNCTRYVSSSPVVVVQFGIRLCRTSPPASPVPRFLPPSSQFHWNSILSRDPGEFLFHLRNGGCDLSPWNLDGVFAIPLEFPNPAKASSDSVVKHITRRTCLPLIGAIPMELPKLLPRKGFHELCARWTCIPRVVDCTRLRDTDAIPMELPKLT